jgi:hypothetical protein
MAGFEPTAPRSQSQGRPCAVVCGGVRKIEDLRLYSGEARTRWLTLEAVATQGIPATPLEREVATEYPRCGTLRAMAEEDRPQDRVVPLGRPAAVVIRSCAANNRLR